MGREKGLTEEKLRALNKYQDSAVFSDQELTILRYADAMADTPVEVSDELFAALRSFLDDSQIVELTSAFAWENYRARFSHALGLDAQGFSDGAFCPMPISSNPG